LGPDAICTAATRKAHAGASATFTEAVRGWERVEVVMVAGKL
jgi:hypothetical protein